MTIQIPGVNYGDPWAKSVFKNTVKKELISVSNSEITNRAQLIDDGQTLKPLLGVERIPFSSVTIIPGEFGPAGQYVYEESSIKDPRVRFVGTWSYDGSGQGGGIISSGSTAVGNFIEIAFYGTGLNLLTSFDTDPLDVRVTIDGGSESGDIMPTGSNILVSRNYKANQILNMTSGLSLGWHTVKIRQNSTNAFRVSGCEIVNERSDIALTSGLAFSGMSKRGLDVLSSTAYKPAGMGTKGGRVVTYLDKDGIGQAYTDVDASQLNLTSADHSNEEIIRIINFREFGAQRADDFSTLTTTSDRAFALDDGTTTLVGDDVATGVDNGIDTLRLSSSLANTNVVLTFVGSGLDLLVNSTGAGNTFESFVNGGSIGTFDPPNGFSKIQKIVSGLPYGSHTVNIDPTALATNCGIVDFIIYGPKKPSIPEDAVEIADYNVLADFDGTTATGTAATPNDILQIPTGVLSKFSTREVVYEGSDFIAALNILSLGGWDIGTSTNTEKIRYTFLGRGITAHFRSTSTAQGVNIRIDGSLNATGVVRSNATNSGGGAYLLGAGTNLPSRIEFTGLSNGIHTIEIEKSTGVQTVYINAFHVHSPIHINHPSLRIGSLSLLDKREFFATSQNQSLPRIGEAKALVHYNGVTDDVLFEHNVVAVIDETTGIFHVVFEKPFKNGKYIVTGCHSEGGGGIDFTDDGSGNRPNLCVIIVRNAGGTTVDPDILTLAFYGELIDE